MVTSGQSLSRAKLETLIEQAAGDEPSESFINDIWLQLEQRQELYGAAAPFETQARITVPKTNWKDCPEYVSCLLWSMLGATNDGDAGPKLFERISRIALARYLKGEALVFGWPVVAGETDTIENKVKTLAETLRERFVEAPAGRYKDRGVDIVGWKPFADGRPSQSIVFTQCAAGHNWRTKTRDVPLKAWNEYVHWATSPTAGLTIPQIVPQELWHEIASEAGLLIDRARILPLVQEAPADAALRDELIVWCEAKIAANAI